MGLFGNKQPKEEPLYKSSYMGFWISVYPNRVECNAGFKLNSIPINQVASVEAPILSKVVIETSGGKKYEIPTLKKKEVQQAIHDAQANFSGNKASTQSSGSDEIARLYELKEKGIISQEEFDQKKKQILGL